MENDPCEVGLRDGDGFVLGLQGCRGEDPVMAIWRQNGFCVCISVLVKTGVRVWDFDRLGATRDEFMSYLSASITPRITKQVKNQLPPKKVSNFAPPVIQSMVTKSLEQAIIAKESSQLQSSYEAAASLT
ncbi:hypothetical protein Tco_1132236 [Tanacetum coccineum]|uniref:Uncharacterized protein n=1 Tax=Tanacetum coccineum TaxID=301880 RepID=A0ABQ5JBB1_9ASTR